MKSEQFHSKVTDIVKQSLAAWDWRSNPLEWEGLPQAVLDLHMETLKDSFNGGPTLNCYGAPFHIDWGKWHENTHTPNSDTVLKIEIMPLEDCDDWAGGSFNLADAIMADASGGDEGYTVAHAIQQLEGTIAKLKSGASARGWKLAPGAFGGVE